METIIYEKDGPIARIILNTPEKANVQTAQQVYDMEECLKWAEDDEEVKVLILKANGKGFCAGHAIVSHEEMAEVYPTTGPTPERTWKKHNYDLFLWPPLHLWEFPKATIAQVHGYCLGGGTVYGYLTDLTVASDDAYFQMPLPQGFALPGAQTMMEPWLLMNWKRAAEYLYLAPTLTAADAMEWGLVNKVVARDDLDATVEEMAATIAKMPLTTIMVIKAGIKRAWDVQAFMRARAGLRPRQMAAKQVGDE
jgi:enoyl-CoA hydratase